MAEIDRLPELYTQREVDKKRKRQRLLGRVEGAAAVVAAGFVWSLLGWIPTVLVIAVVGYVLYRIVSKPKTIAEED